MKMGPGSVASTPAVSCRTERPVKRALAGWLLGVASLSQIAAEPPGDLGVGIFSDLEPGGLPTGWTPLRFPGIGRDTEYALAETDGRVVLRAQSRRSASALVKEVALDPARYPHLTWSWKPGENCFSGEWHTEETDDFPLRLFVVFERSGGFRSFFWRFGSQLSGDAILYLRAPPSTDPDAMASHVSTRIRVIALAAPGSMAQGWERVSRDVHADYVTLFGREPADVKAVAVMSDSDNSAAECTSYFGDIRFSDRRP